MMKRLVLGAFILVMAGALAACGGREDAPAPAVAPTPPAPDPGSLESAPPPEVPIEEPHAPPPVEPPPADPYAQPEAPEPVDAPYAPAPPTDTPIEEAPATPDALHEQLIGTTWSFGDVQAHFHDASTVHLSGGDIANVSPEGVTATYRYADGVIEVDAMGQAVTGTWDGENLVFDGQAATPQ